MKLRVDPDKCQGHARCYGLAHEIFDVDDYGLASVIVDEVPPELASVAEPGECASVSERERERGPGEGRDGEREER